MGYTKALVAATPILPVADSCHMAPSGWHPDVYQHVNEYVYVLVDPRDGKPFYVGKGLDGRVFSHEMVARENRDVENAKLARITEIELAGCDVGRVILRHKLTTDEAFLVEAATIDALKAWSVAPLTNIVKGHGTGNGLILASDLAAEYDPPDAPALERHTILVSLNRAWHSGIPDDELRDVTRKWWTANGWRRNKCELIMGVKNRVVRSVYEIATDDTGVRQWETGKQEGGGKKRPRHRAVVIDDPGSPAKHSELWGKYVGTNVGRFLGGNPQWSFRYADPEV